jgi:Protein of unknown function (DUF998)
MTVISARRDDRAAHPDRAAPVAGVVARMRSRLRVVPNSRTHRLLLGAGLAGSVLFTATFLIDEALRPGYGTLRQPMSALSLGPGGWIQATNFIVFGLLTCASAPGWRASLAPGLGAVWYPRLKLAAGLMLIAAGMFSQDPALGYPPGIHAPATASIHAQLHNVAAVAALGATVAGMFVLAHRLRREPRWRGWGSYAGLTGAAMIAFLGVFGATLDQGRFGGLFEKLATIAAAAFSIALITRLLTHDARLTSTASRRPSTADVILNHPSTPLRTARPPHRPAASNPSPWSWWLTGIVVLGALLTAAGGLLAIHPAGEHLNTAGQNYAYYFLTRNLAMAVLLLLMLALRARRALTGLMILTALIQTLDTITATATGRLPLVPIDLAFTAAFLIGAAHLSIGPLWRATSWRDRP